MRISITKKYEQTISTIFSCLSVSFSLLLIQQFLFPGNVIGTILVLLIIFVSSILIVKTFYFENRNEVFDLTNPTIFETGLLVFQSQQNRCAVFFTFSISSWKFEKVLAQRTLTILLKILPVSTIVAFEWTSHSKCFVNFYIKLEKSSFLTRTRELVDNLESIFKKMLGTSNVHKLNAEDLKKHFSLGIPGIIKQVQRKGKYTISVRTDVTTEKRLLGLINPVHGETINQIFKEFPSQTMRLIFPIQRKDTGLQLADSFVLISDQPLDKKSRKQFQKNQISLKMLHASKSFRVFGDVLSRNIIQDKYKISDFRNAVDLILNTVPGAHHREQVTAPPPKQKAFLSPQDIDPSAWRKLLIQFCSSLELPCSINPLVHIDQIPTRFDAKIGELLIFIVSQTKDQHLRWLFKHLMKILKPNDQNNIVLLITQGTQKTIIENLVLPTSVSNYISIISTEHELRKHLEVLKNRILTEGEAVVQVT
jgi:hypothetical protein